MQSNPQVDNLPDEIEIPKYKSHKIVHALAISKVVHNPNGSVDLFFKDARFAAINLDSVEASRVHAMAEADPGYLVVYDNNYRSWSPTEQFVDGYTAIDDVAQGIGWAMDQLHTGQRVSRSNWNGPGQYLELQVPDENSKMTLPYIYIHTVQGDLVPWLASQTDIQAVDWHVV